MLAESILQFGAGRFLRAFFDRFVQQANEAGQNVGRIVVVQSTPGSRAELLGKQPGGYGVLVRGYADGALVERVDRVQSVSRALIADSQWDEVVALAVSPALTTVVTNATEAGYALSGPRSGVPSTMPGKLTEVLLRRFEANGSPLTILPCELIQRNADTLRALVRDQAGAWSLSGEFVIWATERCAWLNNLVDCIVTLPPADHPLLAEDPLLVSAEPYALLAIERPKPGMPPLLSHPAIQIVDDLEPFYLRKVRILNGAHSAMAAKFQPAGFVTVQQVLDDRAANRWIRDVIYEEIVPTLVGRVNGVAEFADTTIDRLRNPFTNHKLADILNNHAAKVKVRIQPTVEEYRRLFGKPPGKLSDLLV